MTASAVHVMHAPVVECLRLARDTFRLRIACPEIASRIRPGQFVMLRLPRRTDPLLGRAFALYDTDGSHLDLVFLIVGKMTRLMARLTPGDEVEVWGPLGNGFPDYSGMEHLLIVAGGIGQTPFPALIRRVLGQHAYGGDAVKREVEQVTVYYGVRTADLLAGVLDFEARGAAVQVTTDDGSAGFRGWVTDLLERDLASGRLSGRTQIVGCGPEPMLEALARLAQRFQLPCDLSLETPMACGIGICFGCAVKVATTEGWDYRRTCVDGPVFRASALVWPDGRDQHCDDRIPL